MPALKGTRAVSGLTAWVPANTGTEWPLSGWLGPQRMSLPLLSMGEEGCVGLAAKPALNHFTGKQTVPLCSLRGQTLQAEAGTQHLTSGIQVSEKQLQKCLLQEEGANSTQPLCQRTVSCLLTHSISTPKAGSESR